MTILEKYHLEFQIIKDSRNVKHHLIHANDNNLTNYHIIGYLSGQSVEFLIDEVLPEIQRGLLHQSFDSDGGGVTSFLEIGTELSVLSSADENNADISIPTTDIRDLILAWTNWIVANKLSNTI